MTINLDYNTALAALNKAVEAKGAEYIYPFEYLTDEDGYKYRAECRYVRDGAPSCLVGYVLADLGIPLDAFDGLEGSEARTVVRKLHEAGLLDYEGKAADLLNEAQSEQDGGTPWGHAVMDAIQRINEEYAHEEVYV